MWWMSGWRGIMFGWRGWWRSEGLTDGKKQMRTFSPVPSDALPSPSHPLLPPTPNTVSHVPNSTSQAPRQPNHPSHLISPTHLISPPSTAPHPAAPAATRRPFHPVAPPAPSRRAPLPLALTACAPSPRSSGAKPALCEDMRKAGWQTTRCVQGETLRVALVVVACRGQR
jgi:hypothetical protein